MLNLLLDDEHYYEAIEEVKNFAAIHKIEMKNTSEDVVRVATIIMIATEIDELTFVLLTKLIYNIGFRDNNFKSLTLL